MSDDKKPPSAEAPKPATKAGPELKSPREWALATGNGPKDEGAVEWTGNGVEGLSRKMGSVHHEAASVLHGWREHEHHAGEPMMLTLEDYTAALKATHPEDEHHVDGNGEPKRDRWGNPLIKKYGGNPVPHPNALSIHRGLGVRTRLVNGKLVTEKAEASQ